MKHGIVTRITLEDIKFSMSEHGYLMLDVDHLTTMLSRRLLIPTEKATDIIETVKNQLGDQVFITNDYTMIAERVKDFIRAIKVVSRQHMVIERMEEYGIHFIDYSKIYNEKDIEAKYSFHAFINSKHQGIPYVNLTKVFDALLKHEFVSPDESSTFTDRILEMISSDERWASSALSTSVFEYEAKVQRIASKYINRFIQDRWFSRYHNQLMDTRIEPYLILNDDGKVDFNHQVFPKLVDLVQVLGYPDDISRDIVDMTIEGLRDFVDDDGMSFMTNLAFVNCLFINSIEENKTLESYKAEYTHSIEFSQLEIENIFISATIAFTTLENIIELLKERTGKESEDVFHHAVEIGRQLTEVMKNSLKDNGLNPYAVYFNTMSEMHSGISSAIKEIGVLEKEPVETEA